MVLSLSPSYPFLSPIPLTGAFLTRPTPTLPFFNPLLPLLIHHSPRAWKPKLCSNQNKTQTKNPHPNVDSASGVLFHHYDITQTLYYTVTFGVSRGLGPLAQLIWDRALGLPIERPKSVDLKGLMEMARKGRG